MEAGKKLSAAKDYGRAILEFKSAAQAVPADPEPVYQLAIVYMAIRDWRETILHLKKAIELDPKHLPSQLKLAELMATSRRPEILQEAEKKAQDALAIAPDNVQALTALALAEWGQNQRDNAEQHMERAFEKAPQNLRALISLAKMKLARGEKAEAGEALRKAAAVDPPVAEAIAALGEFLVLTGKTAEGERSFRRALEVNPKYWPALLDLARTQYASGRLK